MEENMPQKKIWVTPIHIDELNQRGKNTLSDHLGIEFTEVGDDFLKAKMPIDPKTVQPLGIMHGGASSALAETVASAAGNYCLDLKRYIAVGLELNINHLRPVRKGFVIAIAKPFHLGKKTQVWEIKIYDVEEKLVSISRLTLCVVEKKETPQ